jgi:uncharacterized membrane protein
MMAASFDQIRGSAEGNVAIMLWMLGVLQTIASLTASSSRRRVIREALQEIAETAERTVKSPNDRARFERRLAGVRARLETESVASTHRQRGGAA